MKVLVIGDSCLDKFIYCNIERICPEAPVPVFNSIKLIENGGMPMNVYNNLLSLRATQDIKTNENRQSITKTRLDKL